MVIAFCGHSNYVENSEDEKRFFEILERRIGSEQADFFLGEYGGFDRFAYNCARKYKDKHPDCRLIFITPYISPQYQKNQVEQNKKRFDLILYPELENVPPRYAISHRNKWIVGQADIIIAYIKQTYGGAYSMYRYAQRKNKEVYNIAFV